MVEFAAVTLPFEYEACLLLKRQRTILVATATWNGPKGDVFQWQQSWSDRHRALESWSEQALGEFLLRVYNECVAISED